MDRKIEKKKWPPKKIAGLTVSGLFFVIVIVAVDPFDTSSKLRVEEEKITISTVKKGPFQEFIPVTGTVLPIKTIFLDAREGGQVDTLFIEAGSLVERGDKILQLSNTTLHIQISSQDAQVVEQRNLLTNMRFNMEQNRLDLRRQLLEQEYQIKRLKRLYDRRKKLFERNLISEQEFEATKDEYQYQIKQQKLNVESFKQDSIFQEVQIRQLETSLDRLEQNLEIARQRLEDLTIKAPVSGQLTSLNAEIGQSISQGQRLGQIDVLDGFKVRAGIDEHYLARISRGLNGEFDFAGDTYRLVTDKIYPEVRNGRFEVDMEFVSDSPEGIRRGQTVHIRLELGDLSEALLIPRGGFYQKTGGQWIYVLDESGKVATKREIRLGRQNPQVFEVLEGLRPGERVITSTYDNFGDIDKLVLKK
ncbi:efflux RND transporter periplasmic adaptor subunit [candidate division KSB1 bacterium]|nr:efflux RND transporter periplasmic adaptor subunit [candidate division KSB1 bacterium]NIR70327.1 efflux RND transporter periplasmic adaptor subunit [candidate division KSB1 bacterium]NIT74471.1 efflux RND transporter periplasmic adaptor subunit [candidate division KSB1 bacterium]NIU28996.1 efflux RND transporter periplasmic adaptor subunit [candidate division KSB1 bacterium]NIU91378.1 efflux RND transporter periplasmic adaptor subunit [candidate division KSB1 bacterium]